LASEDMGSSVVVGSSVIDPPLDLLPRSLSHSVRAAPLSRRQASLLADGVGVGEGAATARVASSTVAVCTAATAAAALST